MRWALAALLALLAVAHGAAVDQVDKPVQKHGLGPSTGSAQGPEQDEVMAAFATLLYSDDFVSGVRVLGQSLRETGTQRDLVVIVAGNVSAANVATLAADGWHVRRAAAMPNPGRWTQGGSSAPFPARFWGVYTKLLVFNMTEYESVVFLDADTVALRSLDALLLCDGFCAALRGAERFNTGVLALRPSVALFASMLAEVGSLPSYTGGDQGFLNSFFDDFVEAPFFDPGRGAKLSATPGARPGRRGLRMGRLPTEYNADLGLYVANSNRWTLGEERIKVVHYTLGSFKPWQWWSSWLLGDNGATWQALRQRLPPSADGCVRGQTPRQHAARAVGIPAAWILAVLMVRTWCWRQGLGACVRCLCCGTRARRARGMAALQELPGAVSASVALPVPLPRGFAAAAIAAGLASMAAALWVAVGLLIPAQIDPRAGWILAYEWTALLLLGMFSQHLRLCRAWGRRRVGGGAASPRHRVATSCGAQPWRETLGYCAVLLCMLGLTPWCTRLLRVRTLAGTVLGTAAAAAVCLVVCAHCFVGLAEAWFRQGAAEGGSALGGKSQA